MPGRWLRRRVFQVTDATIASWTKRVAEEGPQALLRTSEPVNKFPDFVRHLVQRLQALCPRLGKVKIAQILARDGLHLSSTTVGRIRREKPVRTPNPQPEQPASVPDAPPEPSKPEAKKGPKRITSRYPDHVWLVDFTTVSLLGGAWTAWLPFALPQCFPFCWRLCVALDHYSRRLMGVRVFWAQPTAEQVKQFLGRVIGKVGRAPRHLITDQGSQFTSGTFRRWCKRRGLRQRFGAIGQHGSIAVIERFMRTLKESLGSLAIIPMGRRSFLWQVQQHATWYNESRPHMSLGGATPDEVYFARRPANRDPRFEPRPSWPRASPCAKPRTLVKGQPGVRLNMSVEDVASHRHLPIVRLKRASRFQFLPSPLRYPCAMVTSKYLLPSELAIEVSVQPCTEDSLDQYNPDRRIRRRPSAFANRAAQLRVLISLFAIAFTLFVRNRSSAIRRRFVGPLDENAIFLASRAYFSRH